MSRLSTPLQNHVQHWRYIMSGWTAHTWPYTSAHAWDWPQTPLDAAKVLVTTKRNYHFWSGRTYTVCTVWMILHRVAMGSIYIWKLWKIHSYLSFRMGNPSWGLLYHEDTPTQRKHKISVWVKHSQEWWKQEKTKKIMLVYKLLFLVMYINHLKKSYQEH